MRLGYRKSEESKLMEKYEVAAFLHAAREIERDARSYYLFALMYLLGLRIGEAIILEWDHVGPTGTDGLPMNIQVPTLKQRQPKPPLISVPVLSHPKLVAQAFDRSRQPKAERRVRSRWLFGGEVPGEHLSKTQAYRLFCLLRDTARLRRDLTPHAFRHTAACELKALGADYTTCKRFLRHTEHDSTEVYMHIKPAQWARFRGALDLPPLKPLAR